jgi:glycosyltransferase involved in cell wall biosynthesis
MTGVVAPPAPPGTTRGTPPSFSVIVAAYQAADTIGEAIASALAQTRAPSEIVVCDDGSTDALDAALEPYADDIVLLRQANAGEGAAKDAAARAARSDFVVVLDADDVFLPGRLAALAELSAARPDLDLLVTDAWFEVDGRRSGRFYAENEFPVEHQRATILERNFIIGHAAIRRTTLLAAGGFDRSMRTVADWECWIRLILHGAVAGLVDEPLSHYRLRAGSLAGRRVEALRWRVRALERNADNPRLSEKEVAILRHSLARHHRRALLAEAEAALRGELDGRRRRLVPLLTTRGFDAATRLKAAAGLLAPGAAARRLEWMEARTGGSRLRRRRESRDPAESA